MFRSPTELNAGRPSEGSARTLNVILPGISMSNRWTLRCDATSFPGKSMSDKGESMQLFMPFGENTMQVL